MGSIHSEAMCWLRFGKRMPIVCTEAGWNADVLGVSDKLAIEVEVKTSKADLQRDFRAKKSKHWHYANGDAGGSMFVPNFFYFLVPEKMAEETIAIVKEKMPKAGVAVYLGSDLLDGRNIRIVKKPTRLKEAAPSRRLILSALLRMSSELCGMKIAVQTLRQELEEKLNTAIEGVALASARAAGALDVENDLDANARAAELAFAVEGKHWADLSELEQTKWRAGAVNIAEALHFNARDWEVDGYQFDERA